MGKNWLSYWVKNWRLYLGVFIGLAGYIIFNDYYSPQQKDILSDLQSSLPAMIDEHTLMTKIEVTDQEVKIYWVQNPSAYAQLSDNQKSAKLDMVMNNALLLCKIQFFRELNASGHKLTLLLTASDDSYARQTTIDKCPVDLETNAK